MKWLIYETARLFCLRIYHRYGLRIMLSTGLAKHPRPTPQADVLTRRHLVVSNWVRLARESIDVIISCMHHTIKISEISLLHLTLEPDCNFISTQLHICKIFRLTNSSFFHIYAAICALKILSSSSASLSAHLHIYVRYKIDKAKTRLRM